eukprot:CAMPEP_0170481082 /NCGR_PEP_ID=MMETSP0208-20121228/1665_1 /TAXON_ID=197538 /ORGANISM="Strombidium inclinatum, Strain S3" /LENGTH=279 /DNA_ID=CAMNT_0010753727 /DNA_START=216 /DNA_END=1054 /DNA_ORIENTATION=+
MNSPIFDMKSSLVTESTLSTGVEGLLARADGEHPDLSVAPQFGGYLIRVESGVVADDASVDLHFQQAILVYIQLRVEVRGCSRRSSRSIAHRYVVDRRIFTCEVLAVEARLLAVVVVGNDQDFICQHLRDPVLAEEVLHDLIKLIARVERVGEGVDGVRDGNAQNKTQSQGPGDNDPELVEVGHVGLFCVFDLRLVALDLFAVPQLDILIEFSPVEDAPAETFYSNIGVFKELGQLRLDIIRSRSVSQLYFVGSPVKLDSPGSVFRDIFLGSPGTDMFP